MVSPQPKMYVDTTLLTLNRKIQSALEAYLPEEFSGSPGRIRFGMFDKDNLPDQPTVYVFLYDIQEDLELRHAHPRYYSASDDTLNPRYVHVRCCYLVTYWEAKSETVVRGQDSQQSLVNNMALNALLNLKLDMPSAFVRVIAPSEHLSSLGSLWQSLGDKPRLCLSFTVTVPIELGKGQAEHSPRVLSTLSIDAGGEWEHDDVALAFKRALLTQVLNECGKKLNITSAVDWGVVRTKLARLQVFCEYMNDLGHAQNIPVVRVVGVLDTALYTMVKNTIMALQSEWAARATVDCNELYSLPDSSKA